MVTKQSGDTWEGSVGGEIGNYDAYRATFWANGPIAPDLLYASVWGSLAGDGGWIENQNPVLDDTANDEEQKRFGLNLLLTPTADFSARLHLIHDEHDKGHANGGITADFNQADRADFEDANYEEDTFSDITVDSQGLHLEYNTGLGTFESITTHRTTDGDGRWDYDYTTGNPAFDNQGYTEIVSTETTSQEFRWSHELDSGTRWVAGLFFEREDTDFDNFGFQAFNTENRWVSENGSETQAVFGQVVLPFLDDFELTLGGRYQWIDKDIDLDRYVTPIIDGTVTLGVPVYELNADESWTAFLPKAAFSYRVNDDWTAYASVAKGYMPGGFNYVASAAAPGVADNQFGPQETVSYEIGTKAGLLDDRLFLSAAAFYMDIKDIHVYVFDPNLGTFVTSNAAEASSYGLEVEADFLINERWQANAALAVTNAEYDDYTDAFGNVNDGNKTERTTAHKINLGLQYNDPSGFYGRVDLANVGNHYFDAPNTLEQDAYTLVNLKVGYATDSWEVYAYAENVTDTDYKTFGQTKTPTETVVEFGDPREFGLGVMYRF